MTGESRQRRLSAILAADVAGYTKLVEKDTDGTVVAWQTARNEIIDPAISEHSGRIVKHTGDGFLAEFSSVQDAVICAIDLQKGLANSPLEFRVGISLGDVVDDGEDIHGEGVNIAARIEALADPGGISISGSVYEQVRNRIEQSFVDMGEHEVKHVSAPVRVYRVKTRDAESFPTGTVDLALPDKPSIAVLPFDNLSSDEEQEFFADGMAEEIITSLSHYRSLFVIARNSTFAYKGQSPDLRDVSRDLGVRYVLEGSVRKSGPRIRVTGQLIEGATGKHIWAERYDRKLDDVFAVQDEVTQAIVAAIGPEIDQAERDRAQRLAPENLDVWESYQRGLWHLYRFNGEDNAEAQRLFKRAVAVAPNFAPAQSGLTHALYFSLMHGYAADRPTTLVEAYDAGRRAVAADERDADAHFALGRILYLRHDLDTSIAEFETAISHNPNLAHAYIGFGTALVYAGQFDRAVENLELAVRLSPNDPLLWLMLAVKAMALICSEQYEGAAEVAGHATRHPNAAWTAPCFLASALGHLGETVRAEEAFADVLQVKPDLSPDHLRQILPFRDPAHFDRIIEGLLKAGFSE